MTSPPGKSPRSTRRVAARYCCWVGVVGLAAAVFMVLTTPAARHPQEPPGVQQIAVVLLGRDFPRNPFTPRGGLAGCRFGNAFGHTAIAMTGGGVNGKGNHVAAGTDLTTYLADNTRERDVTVYIINATPAQAAAVQAYFRSKSSERDWKRNCATAVAGALQAAGYDVKTRLGVFGDPHFPADVASVAAALANETGGLKLRLEKGAVVTLEQLRSFDRVPSVSVE